MTPVQVSFRLQFVTRRDDEANVYVGYCPALKLYSQGTTEQEAGEAVVSAVKLFLVACYERDLLHSALRTRGMTRASSMVAAQIKNDENKEFVSISERPFDKEFWRDVPINLLAAQEVSNSCLQ
jgi:predicted RNase H-like HicB family nuclease